MVRSRSDEGELPLELEEELGDILEADDEARRQSFNSLDEFDAAALLSQPFFDDSNGDLNVDESELADIQFPQELDLSGNSTSLGPNMNQAQSNFQQQINDSSYDQNSVNRSPNQSTHHQMNVYTSGIGEPGEAMNEALSTEETINLQVQEVRRKIQEVQEQIERAQLETANSRMQSQQLIRNDLSSLQQQPQGIQNDFEMQGLMNHTSAVNRNPPGRSVSMPIRRNQMQGSPLNQQPAFMMQQPIQELQRQQPMTGNSHGNSVHNGMDIMQGFNNQGPSMMGNSVDISSSSHERNMQSFVRMPSLEQQQAIQGGPSDVSVSSAMNTMQGLNLGGVSMDGSMNSTMSNMQQGYTLDSSVRSIGNTQQGYTLDSSVRSMGHMQQGYTLDSSVRSMGHMQQGFTLDSSVRSIGNMQQGYALDLSVRSMPAGMPSSLDQSMFMIQQQQGMDDMLPNMVFGADGQAIRQNSLPKANSSNIAMPQVPPHNDLMVPSDFDLAQMQRGFQAQGLIPGPAGSASGQPMGLPGRPGVSMEKLCESMRRSAMSRSLVKQLSGRSLSRASSGRGLPKTLSGRPRHRIQRDALSSSLHTPKRGVFRHKSQSAAMGGNNQKTVVNIDGNMVGMF